MEVLVTLADEELDLAALRALLAQAGGDAPCGVEPEPDQ